MTISDIFLDAPHKQVSDIILKVLLVTAQLAKNLVEKYAAESRIEFEIITLPVPVAALLNAAYIARELRTRKVKGYSLILTPGMVFGDLSLIDKATGIPTFKGPKYVADLPFVLNLLDEIKLSKTMPACEIHKNRLQLQEMEDLRRFESGKQKLLGVGGNMLIGSLAVGKDFPMRIMAEINETPTKNDFEIAQAAKYFIQSGAEIIDIGMVAGESHPEDALRAVHAVRRFLSEKTPISIDTMDPAEAEAGIKAGADMLLSVDASNCMDISGFASEVTVVVIPTDHHKGIIPKEASARTTMLEKVLRKVSKLGFNKVVGDLVLDSLNTPGLMESLISYSQFRKRNKNIPLLMGVANVTELTDADSIGMNALLAGIASELGVSILLATEASDKTKGSVAELSTASKMMYLAKRRSSVPKDMTLNLLKMKEKRNREEPYQKMLEDKKGVILAEYKRRVTLDPKGCFKIMVDRAENEIVAMHYLLGGTEPDVIIKGRSARDITQTITDYYMLSRLDHATYLGAELAKAEIALKIGRSYLQDNSLFD